MILLTCTTRATHVLESYRNQSTGRQVTSKSGIDGRYKMVSEVDFRWWYRGSGQNG